jgi:8-oxo-dGTP pyrophosphatase MutT (NUDIX family)
LLVVRDHRGEQYILPGGRSEPGELTVDTLHRELLEEIGIAVGRPIVVGFLHFHHLGPRPQGYQYPYPDFVQLVYRAKLDRRVENAKLADQFVTGFEFRPAGQVVASELPEYERPFLQFIRSWLADETDKDDQVALSEPTRWKSGDQILLRTLRQHGNPSRLLPVTVVQDTSHLLALYLAPGTLCSRLAGRRGGPKGRQLIEATGGFEEWTWRDKRRLFLWHPHEAHAVSLFWRKQDDVFLGWYVDVCMPLRRTPTGFDTRDLILDVVIAPDRTWSWKDEDELLWAQNEGQLAPYDADFIRREATRAIALLTASDPLFADHWTNWRPDPTWPIPAI